MKLIIRIPGTVTGGRIAVSINTGPAMKEPGVFISTSAEFKDPNAAVTYHWEDDNQERTT